MVRSQEEPAAARGTSEAQPAGPAPLGAAPLPGSGPLDGPEAVAAEKVEVELVGPAGAEPPEPPEGGWGWVVMLAAMWCNGSVFGFQNACGVLFVSMLKTFGSKDDDKMVFKTGLYSWHMEVTSLGTGAAGLHHSNAGSLTYCSGAGIKPESSWLLVRFITAESQWELLNF